MSSKKKAFSSLAAVTVGVIAGSAIALRPVAAFANDEHGHAAAEKGCSAEKKSCSADKKSCSGAKTAEGTPHADHNADHKSCSAEKKSCSGAKH